ncbi:hypothetical protein H0H92_011693 [Tricholoma furcatifolium]|nr:hypothetical protein H0H92_011693 [Tricholoma furcatifolium]
MIPKPREFRYRYRLDYPLYKIRALYQGTDEQFTALKSAVRKARARYLAYCEGGNITDPEKRKEIENQVLPLCPELQNFEDHWPLYAILERLAKFEVDDRARPQYGLRRRKKANSTTVKEASKALFLVKHCPQIKERMRLLAKLGIVNDHHLFIMKTLNTWGEGPEPFLNSVSRDALSVFHRLSLLENLKKAVNISTTTKLEHLQNYESY